MVIAAPSLAWHGYYNQASTPLLHFCWNFANIMHLSLTGLSSRCEIICPCKSANNFLIPFVTWLPQQIESKWSWPMGVGGMSTFLWMENGEVCVQMPGQTKNLRWCVKTWAVGKKSYRTCLTYQPSTNSLWMWSSWACTLQSILPTWASATSSNMLKMIKPVTKGQPLLFVQVRDCFQNIHVFKNIYF